MKKACPYIFPDCFVSIILPISLFIAIGCNNKPPSPFSKKAEEALSTFKLAPGFKIELVASEPMVNDPVDMMIDESGKLYVVEMMGVPFNKSGVGKVVVLSDTNSDGRMDKSVVFADSLVLPSGIMRWKKGVIVTDPPNVYYLEDKNGDDVADSRTIMLTGFDTTNLEANVNNPEYGLDNWIYLADVPVNKGGEIHFAGDSNDTGLKESTLRFRPDTREIENTSGKTQFGHTFDSWGNYMMVNNSNHIYQEMIAERYLRRNPNLIVPGATQTLGKHAEVFSITKNPEYQMLTDVGVFTSACGLNVYQGGAFPNEYNNNISFVAEPASNVLHADRLQDTGATFNANRLFERKEFLASTDPYSRPVNTYVGPDGALYVVDFYRQVIEGPEFMSEEVLKKVDLYNGTGLGRIYRISASGAPAADWTNGLHLGEASDEELVGKLNDKNIWWRLNAQRLLVDRKSEQSIAALIKMAGNHNAVMGRLHALWTLEGISKLTPDIIIKALKDPLPGIRVNAIKLAELHLSKDPRLVSALLAMRNDTVAKVRFQLLCTLGFVNTAEADDAREALLFRDINDKWVQIAALSAGSSQSLPLLNAMIARFDSSVEAHASLVQLLGSIIGKSQEPTIIRQLLHKGISESSNSRNGWQSPLLEGISEGLDNRKPLPSELGGERPLLIRASLENGSASIRKSAMHLLEVIGLANGSETAAAMLKAKKIAGDRQLKQEQRSGAIDFLALRDPSAFSTFLKSLVQPQSPILVQLAAIRALSAVPGEEISKYLLQQWTTLTPGLRNEAVNLMMVNPKRVKLLLDEVESGEINRGSISWPQSVRLRSGGEYMERARVLLTENDVKRKDVIDQYKDALQIKASSAKGMTVYQVNCAICHQIAGKSGRAFGPDLGTVHAWSPSDILTNILDPNKSIAHNYDMWLVKLNNGKTAQGIISTETPTAITLSSTEGETTNIARQDISTLTALGMSAMPIDFEKKINKQQMADLLAFLRQVE